MEEENKVDVNVEETPQGEPEAKAEDTPSDPSADKSVPYSRFKEVNDKMNSMKERIDSLQNTSKGRDLTPKEQEELNAKSYLRNMLKDVLTEEERTKNEAEAKEVATFNSEVDSILEFNSEIKRNDFIDFIEKNSEKYGIESVKGAMALYKDLNQVKAKAKDEGKKEVLNKPKFPSGDGGIAAKGNYDVKGKSIYDIAREAADELSKH